MQDVTPTAKSATSSSSLTPPRTNDESVNSLKSLKSQVYSSSYTGCTCGAGQQLLQHKEKVEKKKVTFAKKTEYMKVTWNELDVDIESLNLQSALLIGGYGKIPGRGQVQDLKDESEEIEKHFLKALQTKELMQQRIYDSKNLSPTDKDQHWEEGYDKLLSSDVQELNQEEMRLREEEKRLYDNECMKIKEEEREKREIRKFLEETIPILKEEFLLLNQEAKLAEKYAKDEKELEVRTSKMKVDVERLNELQVEVKCVGKVVNESVIEKKAKQCEEMESSNYNFEINEVNELKQRAADQNRRPQSSTGCCRF